MPHHVLLVCWRPYFRASMVLISRVHCLQSPPVGDFGVDDDPANPTHELTIANLGIGNEWPTTSRPQPNRLRACRPQPNSDNDNSNDDDHDDEDDDGDDEDDEHDYLD